MSSHIVFGAGLIGTYLAAALIHNGHTVRVRGRQAVELKLAKGVALSDYHGNRTPPVPLENINSASLDNGVDFLWLTVKCHGVGDAVAAIGELIGPETVILCCQNGLGSDRLVREAYPDQPVVRVMVPFNVVETDPGVFHRGSEGSLTLESAPGIDGLISSLTHPILPVETCDEMEGLLWAKLQLNLSNAVNALADIPVKAMLEQRRYRLLIAALMEELLQVADGLGISLPKLTRVKAHWLPWVLKLPNALFTLLANKMLAIDPQVRTSMWWDLSAEKPTEIDFLNGALVEQGRAVGIDCRKNQRLVGLIKQAQQGELKQGLSAEHLYQLVCI